MADVDPEEKPLECLPAQLHFVLKETGKFFCAAQSNDLNQISNAKSTISQAIPKANQRFHLALDEIEIEIIKAKSVFERDLASIRSKRAERERVAAGILKAKKPNGIVKSGHQDKSPVPEKSTAVPSSPKPQSPQPNGLEKRHTETIPNDSEAPVVNGVSAEQPLQPSEPPDQAVSSRTQKEPLSSTQELPNSTSVAPEAPMIANPKSNPEPVAKSSQENPTETPTTGNFNNADFESMFTDTNMADPSSEIDFDLSFTNDQSMGGAATDLLNDSTSQNTGANNDSATDGSGQNNNTTSNDEDINSLLPGLENFVNSDDFSLTNSSTTNTNNNNSSNQNLGAGGENVNKNYSINTEVNHDASNNGNDNGNIASTETAPLESSFDDLFGLSSYLNGTGEDELGGTDEIGEVAEFNEDWFKMNGM